MNWLTAFWTNHGTKVLGTITLVCTACNGGDHYLTKLLTNEQHAIISLVLSVVGALTLHRGFSNSKRP